jgi:hypothetical protein
VGGTGTGQEQEDIDDFTDVFGTSGSAVIKGKRREKSKGKRKRRHAATTTIAVDTAQGGGSENASTSANLMDVGPPTKRQARDRTTAPSAMIALVPSPTVQPVMDTPEPNSSSDTQALGQASAQQMNAALAIETPLLPPSKGPLKRSARVEAIRTSSDDPMYNSDLPSARSVSSQKLSPTSKIIKQEMLDTAAVLEAEAAQTLALTKTRSANRDPTPPVSASIYQKRNRRRAEIICGSDSDDWSLALPKVEV